MTAPTPQQHTRRDARAIRRKQAAAEKAGKQTRLTQEAVETLAIADDVAEGLGNLSTDYLRKKCKSVKDEHDPLQLGASLVLVAFIYIIIIYTSAFMTFAPLCVSQSNIVPPPRPPQTTALSWPASSFPSESFLRDNNWLHLYHHNTTAAGNSGRGRLALSAAKERERLETSCAAAGTRTGKGTKSRVQDLKETSLAVR